MKPAYTVAACVSRPEVYRDLLLASVNADRADAAVELLPVWNLEGRYSAAVALNLAFEAARSDVLVFAHQDVELLPGWFERLRLLLAALPANWAVLGAAGVAAAFGRADVGRWGGALRDETVAVGVVHDAPAAAPYWNGLVGPTPIHVADECLFVANRRLGMRFDPAFAGYHFYGADLCLQARAAGYFVYGAALPLVHHGRHSSSLVGDLAYWPQLRLLHSKWAERFPEALGTHFHWADRELTSYIPFGLESSGGQAVAVRSFGVRSARVQSDGRRGIVPHDLLA